jgi:3-hydroxyacyl-[acyl-carrier-protein] dehydratase
MLEFSRYPPLGAHVPEEPAHFITGRLPGQWAESSEAGLPVVGFGFITTHATICFIGVAWLMAPQFLYDLGKLDLNKITIPIEEIRKVNPHRYEMEQLSGIIHIDYDKMTAVGVKHVGLDEFWVRGHIPGRPLMPGVLMLESAAQLCAYVTRIMRPEMGFIGFAKADSTRFRGTVVPPNSFYIIAQMAQMNRRRVVANCQGMCDGMLTFETVITGMPV